MNKIKGLDIFCGAGGSSAGARAAGVEMLGGIDMCPIATKTYQDNFPTATVKTDRLENISISALAEQIGRIDLLLASPECTNHTCAKGAAPRSEASRATAMFALDYARVFKPRWIVMENVVHMRPWSRYGALKKELEALGYKVGEQVLNASDFGVAQSRRRLFIVGDRERAPPLVSQKRPGRRKTVKSILDPAGTWKSSPLRTTSRAGPTLARAQRGFDALGDAAEFLLVYYGTDGGGGWQSLDRPLRTVTTIDRFGLVQHDDDGPTLRMLQVPELKRAMGFHDDYRFDIGTRRERVRLLGNGVCPPVMTEVVSALTAAA
jgi:DNA (cytosine-5)-methyltransferase 1